ncbi:hypothetical protein [Polyangium mundeleinium]|uniref:Uncharacterized protein n=1 Tax=Polyangium mundeleinium TaxID=2995306 RepID=A0ABT5ETL3_9BACT|nr:hypothetical protein [Polyangium mundeleinium]MDC0744689.1 hypothetical protein [Polyangium mundeleinium]
MLRRAFFLRGAWSSSWRPSRVCLVLLLAFGLVLSAPPVLAQECKRKTPIHYIGMCMHPHGPAHNEWTYDFSGNPVFGPAARQLVACHDVLPLFVFDPRADLKNRGLIPLQFHDKAGACEPSPPPKPKPVPPPAPAKKEDPPPKEKARGDEGGGGKGGSAKGDGSGGGGDSDSIEKRVEKHRIRREGPPDKESAPQDPRSKDMVLPKESGALSKERVLPSRDEVHPPKCVDESCTLVDRGGALPEHAFRSGAPVMSAGRCQDTKQGCAGKGDGTGKGKALTPLERMVRELAIASAMLNGEFNHDLARKDGKRFGVIGGDDEDGVDNAIVQAAAAITQVASAVLVGQAEKFAKKLEEACAKKAPILLQGAEELSKETAEILAKQYGRAIAEALEQNGAIGPYKTMREFTRGLEGDFQAHHILEKAIGRDLRITKELDNIPSVILTKEHHKKITDALDEARKRMIAEGIALRPRTLWKMYEEVYAPYPRWLDAIKPYFFK